jgi:hypothetical protein
MPCLSEQKHRLPYVAPPDVDERLKEVAVLLRVISDLPIDKRIKVRMLNHALWLVVEFSGNFFSRYRSAGVLASTDVPIQRDHVFTRNLLVRELFSPDADIASVIERAICCIVTVDEHRLLSKVPTSVVGWDRYQHAGIVVHDMEKQK